MSLTSLSFLGVYFPLLLLAYYNPFWKSNFFRKTILAFASIGLYTICEPIYVLLLMSLILINYVLVKISDKMSRLIFRAVAIVIDVSVLLFFKYINSFLALYLVNDEVSIIVFPIGLSYFTFKAISYVVDSNKKKDGSLLDIIIYISNFLTIVSGPLSTYQDELPMIQRKRYVSFDSLYISIERLIIGFAKKVLIADSLSVLVRQCFSTSELSLVMAWTGAVAYTLQLYFDFSGYTDMAIGIGQLFGFELPDNFNYPYMATSVSDFWKRWHISLTKWFTKYIYIPLGGSRVRNISRHVFNSLVVWLVTGIWHGSSMTFIIWALIYFVLQTLEKHTRFSDIINKFHIGHIYTLLVVIIEWVIFKSESVGKSLFYIKTMFGLNKNSILLPDDFYNIKKYIIPILLGVIFSMNNWEKIKRMTCGNKGLNILYNSILLVTFGVCIIICISQGYSAPLYAGF